MNEQKFILFTRELYTIGRKLNRDFTPTVQATINIYHETETETMGTEAADTNRAARVSIANNEFRTDSFF